MPHGKGDIMPLGAQHTYAVPRDGDRPGCQDEPAGDVEAYGVRNLATGAPTSADTVFQTGQRVQDFTAHVCGFVRSQAAGLGGRPMWKLLRTSAPGRLRRSAVNVRDLLMPPRRFRAFSGTSFDHLGLRARDVAAPHPLHVEVQPSSYPATDRPIQTSAFLLAVRELAQAAAAPALHRSQPHLIFQADCHAATASSRTLIGLKPTAGQSSALAECEPFATRLVGIACRCART